jgi:hypothetical protein
MQNIRVAEKLSAYQEGLCSTVGHLIISYIYTHRIKKHGFMVSELQFRTKTPLKPYKLVYHVPVYLTAHTLCSESQYNDS